MTIRRWGTSVVVAAAIVLGVDAWPAAAAAKLTCPGRQVVDRIDAKVCPANKMRPAITVQRVCCRKPNGKVRCKAFKKCPRRSPSA